MGEHGTVVVIHWVPGCMYVDGKEKADEAAKEAADGVNITGCPEGFPSITHIGHTISERK